MRGFTIVVIVVNLLLSCFILYKSYATLEKDRRLVYILWQEKAMQAVAADGRENMPVEARDHIRTFHQEFFTLDPDEKVIRTNIGRALYLADGSARQVYENLKRAGITLV